MGRGFGVTAAVDHDVVRDIASEAERLGYSSLWVNDLPHADGLASLVAAAESTQRIRLGVGVIPLDRRPADVIARQVLDSSLPLDRLILGVGSGGGRSGSLARVRTGCADLDRAVDAIIVVGSLGPRMSALAGEVADGVVFNWLTPEHAADAGRSVREAAESAGRPKPAVIAYVRCALIPAARRRFDEEVGHYAGNASFEAQLAHMGVDAEHTCVLGPDAASLQRGIARYEAVLDETVVRAITPTDSVDALVELMRACAPTTAD